MRLHAMSARSRIHCAIVHAMPELIQRQHCISAEPWFSIPVSSQSEEGKVYTVLIPYPDDDIDEFTCECLGYTHRGWCHHQEIADELLCRWTEKQGPEKQTDEQRGELVCPRCGNKTVRSSEWQ